METHRAIWLGLAVGLTIAGASVPAQEVRQQAAAATENTAAVPSALARLPFLQGRPAMDARYYIYVQSASWCGPCRKYMPVIAAAYGQLREAGVEVILTGRDADAETTLAYAQGHKMPFPVLQTTNDLADTLPGFSPARAIPHIQVVDAAGTLLLDGHPQHLFDDGKWKDVLKEWEDAPAGSIHADMDDEAGRYTVVVRHAGDMADMLYTMAQHMRAKQNFQSRTPNPGCLVAGTCIAGDIMSGFSISGEAGVHTLTPAYLDCWRMLHAAQSKGAVRVVDAPRNSGGNALTHEEYDALQALKTRLAGILTPGMGDADKVLAIYHDLVRHTSCRKDAADDLPGLISGNTGSPEAYTRYMFLALNMSGIPCHRITATDASGRTWNLVKLDNKWYHLDASANTCCVSDSTMAEKHQWDRSIYPEAPEDYPCPPAQ